jgi:hypothetical protein
MSPAKPSIVGSAFSLTVGVGYTLCAIIVALFPDPSYSFLSSLFHGGNVSALQPAAGAFTFVSYFISLVALMVTAFALGVLYSYALSFLSSKNENIE